MRSNSCRSRLNQIFRTSKPKFDLRNATSPEFAAPGVDSHSIDIVIPNPEMQHPAMDRLWSSGKECCLRSRMESELC